MVLLLRLNLTPIFVFLWFPKYNDGGFFMEVKMNKNKMATKPIFPLLLTMGFPAMLSMFIQSMYNIIDSMFVAQISQDALTAVSLAFPIQNVIVAVAVGTGVGVNSLIARRLGEGKQQEASEVVSHGVILAVISSLAFIAFAFLGVRIFFNAYTSSNVIFNYGVAYTQIICLFSFGSIIHICIEKVLQATGNMILPMIFQIVGCVINIILDPIFIFGYGFIPSMGIQGAAIATIIGQISSMLLALTLMLAVKHEVQLSFKQFKFKLSLVKDIYAVGIPSILVNSVGSFLVMALNAILISINTLAVPLLGIYFKLQSFVTMPVSGLTQGAMPIFGYNYGAKNQKRFKDTLKYSLLVASVILLIGTILFFVAPVMLLKLFNASNELITLGISALRILSLSFVFSAIGLVFATLFQAIGKGGYSLLISLLRQLLIIIPLAYVFSLMNNLNLVWSSFIIAEVISGIVSVILYKQVAKNEINVM